MNTLRKRVLAVFAGMTLGSAGSLYFSDEVLGALQGNETDVAAAFNASAAQCEIPENLTGGIVARERSCLTLGAFLEDPEAYKDDPSYEPLMAIYNSSSFSRDMLERVVESDPKMRLCDMELSSTLNAVYDGVRVGVDFERDRTTTAFVSSIVHEMAHHYQKLNGADYFDYRRSLADNQRVMLAMETAAPVVEQVALQSAAEAGTIDWQTELGLDDPKYYHQLRFSRYYNARISAGLGPDDALNVTAQHRWQETLKSQHKLDHYNKAAVRFTLLQMGYLEPEHATYQDPKLDEMISISGYFTEKVNFIDLTKMPEGKDLFGQNDSLRAISEAVEWYRLNYMLGDEDPQVIAGWQTLTARNNPYAQADFAAAACKIRQGTDVQEAFDTALPPPEVEHAAVTRKPAASGIGL